MHLNLTHVSESLQLQLKIHTPEDLYEIKV